MADAKPKVLVVEDEPHLSSALKLNLELEGYDVRTAATGREAAAAFLEGVHFDVVVLDVMLPDVDGFELCRKMRDAGHRAPVLMLTARGATKDRVAGLEAGADDYLTKPFELAELLARIRSLLRRRKWLEDDEPTATDGSVARFGQAVVDFDRHEATVRGEPVHLTKLELDLLRYFVSHPHRVLSRDELLENVWKIRHASSPRMVDNFVMRLRRHFEDDPTRPRFFVSVRGAGYKFVPPAETAPSADEDETSADR
ncbi:MAG: DNA-binding response regulator [Deltaproteobacteria bacterium]|nr:MAG: DNA-binding response regulator [Deltaproteobacteria bacterium]